MVSFADPALLVILLAGTAAMTVSVLAAAAGTIDHHARRAELRLEVGRLRRARRRKP